MGTVQDPFPDVEVALLDYLAGLGDTVTSTPIDLQERLPLHRIRRVGGPDDDVTDQARVEIFTYHETRTQARDSAEEVRQRILALPARVGGVVLDRGVTEQGPSEIAYTDSAVRLFGGVYRVSVRR